jgi:hypothetical protein
VVAGQVRPILPCFLRKMSFRGGRAHHTAGSYHRGMAGEVRLHLLVMEGASRHVVSCRSVDEARDEWFRSLRRDPLSAGFLHCGQSPPQFAEVEALFRPGRMVISDSARQILPQSLTPAFTMLGFSIPPLPAG